MFKFDRDTEVRMLPVFSCYMIIALVLFNGMTLVVNSLQGRVLQNDTLMYAFMAGALLSGIIFVYCAQRMYQREVKLVRNSFQTSTERIVSFRAITIMHHALCEMPAIIGSLSFMLFGHPIFLIPVVMGLVEMLRKFPRKEKMEKIMISSLFNS